ncbi:hypothetical protein PR202_gb11915 [Eleusine coracana subsp. coracana]|uniref:Uncharacterized protein n=1 Tax=Eleusine coracana subsp. coracana TaxID=191504 RepID=A0AAV5EP57_ELECO|nr:hypothetical protein PR202_gb11915 [Eleusine coracana subsp. coracana]
MAAMEDDGGGGAGGHRVTGAATQDEQEHQCRTKAKGKEVAHGGGAGRSSCGAGGSGLSNSVDDRTKPTPVVTRSGEHVSAKPIIFLQSVLDGLVPLH